MTVTAPVPVTDQREQDVVYAWFQSGHWTEQAYLALAEMNRPIELSEGRLILQDMPTMKHQDIVHALVRQLDTWIAEHAKGKVYFAPVPIRLWPGKFREPDVFVYLETPPASEAAYAPAPDMIIEVLSPGTRRVDMGDKFDEYAMAGVREYWQVDPEARVVYVYTLKGERYAILGVFSPGQTACSELLPGFTVRVDELLS